MALGFGIAYIIALIVILIIVRIFFKTVFKIFAIIWFVLFLGSIAFGVLVYQDVNDLSKNLAESNNLFLLESDGALLAGFATKGSDDEPEIVEQIEEIQVSYEKNDFEGIASSGDYYKIFVINEKSFDGIGEIEIHDFNASADEVLNVIKAGDPAGEYIDLLERNEYTDIGSESENDAKIKGALFALLFSAGNLKEGPLFLLNNYKEGNIIIYEETLIFKVVKYVPISFLESLQEKKR